MNFNIAKNNKKEEMDFEDDDDDDYGLYIEELKSENPNLKFNAA